MKLKFSFAPFMLIVAMALVASCQKEIDSSINGGTVVPPADQKPKVGTVWTYNYITYYSFGGAYAIKTIKHRAQNEETFGGETWLNIIDVDANTTVYYLNTKTGGLYQYANNSSNLFCKQPAVVNDTYNSYNDGSTEDFTVKGVNDTLPTGIGDIPVNYYQGVKNGDIIDHIYYNKNAWIVQRVVWRRSWPPGPTVFYRYSTMYIDNIVY